MHPADGRYRLTSNPSGNPPRQYDMLVEVVGNVMRCTFGDMEWVASSDFFHHEKADIAIRCEGAGTFTAIVKAGTPQEQTYAGTCTAVVG